MSTPFYPGFDTKHWNPFVGCDHGANVPVWIKQVPVFKGGKWVVSSDLADFPPDLQVQEKPL